VLSNEKFQGVLSLIPGFGVELMRLLSARLREVKPAEYGDGMYDHLTNALSRQAFDLRLQEEIKRANLYRYTFSLVFLDLDHFKDVNDNYGHARGDEVLIEFARRIMADLRTTDMLFRYGGDEFVLLLQGIDETRGPSFVQRLLDGSLTTPIPGDPPVTVSFSAGIAYFPEDGLILEELLKAADERVYHAKAAGRGRIT
jgi:diguanylate cyclase (GGDEF)-like protein